MTTDEDKDFEKITDLASRIRKILINFGTPREVLSSVMLIAIVEARGAGTTLQQFQNTVRALWEAFENKHDN